MAKIATIGFFDGVHKGHCFLFEHLRSLAKERGLQPLIITFDIHPRSVLQTDYVPQLLTTAEERKALLSRYGEVVMLSFEEVQPMTAAEFMQMLHARFDVSVLLMGYDHRFGSDRLTRPQDFRAVGDRCGMEVITLGEFIDGEWRVSSTEIRTALLTGNILIANELLGRPYAVSGLVVHGKAIGRTIGFPTANVQPADVRKIIPKPGVYVVTVIGHRISVSDERLEAKGFCNIDRQNCIEVHIPSFKGDLYDWQLEIRFERFLRDEKRFDSLDDLREQIKADVDSIRRLG